MTGLLLSDISAPTRLQTRGLGSGRRKGALLGTVATACLALGLSMSQAAAQSAGGQGGGLGGEVPSYGAGGVGEGAKGGDALGDYAGGGGGGPDGPGGQSNNGGSGGPGGASATEGVAATPGSSGGDADYFQDGNTYVDLGAGGGGAGGTGIIVGAGSFSTAVSVTAPQGGDGGNATYNLDVANPDPAYGSSTGSFSGGYGGDGGVGLAISGSQATVTSGITIMGGYGGAGGYGQGYNNGGYGTINGYGGNGGKGGAGILIQLPASVVMIQAGATVHGGNGGDGGDIILNEANFNATFNGTPGLGGAGGDGIDASNATINNAGTIQGGDGGADGVINTPISASFRSLVEVLPTATGGAGGMGIVGSNLTVDNAGLIEGGLYAGGARQTVAINFTGGTNILTLEAGTDIVGIAQAYVAGGIRGDTFALGGPTDASLDVSTIVDSGTPATLTNNVPNTLYEGFGIFQKTGSSTWTLSGTTTYPTPWEIIQGTLAISADNNLSAPTNAPPPAITLNGGNLQVTASFETGRTVIIGANGGGLVTGFSPTVGLAQAQVTEPNATLTLDTPFVDGGGQLVKYGLGTLHLTADNTYAGGTLIAEGTVLIDKADGLGTGTVAMDNGTTLAFGNSFSFANAVTLTNEGDPTIDTGANTDTMSGVISGPGALTKAGTGTLILTGLNDYTGGTTVANGKLVGSATSFGSGPVDIAVAAATLEFNQPTTANFGNAISGPGALIKTGAGQLDLTGTNIFTGATTLQQGTLLVDGSTANSVVTARNGTTLGGFGTVGGIVALSGSTVAPGLVVPYSTLHVNGNVNFQAGSTYQVQINAAGQTNLILATGTATIAGGTVNVTAVNGAYNAAERYTIVTAQAGRTGTFSNLTTTTNLAFLRPYLTYDPNDVILAFQVQNPTTVPVCQTVNQRAAQSGLVGLGAGNQLFNKFLGQTLAGAREACDAVSGEIHASAATAAFEDNRFPRESILDRLDDAAHDGPNAYGTLGAFGAAPGLPPGAQGYAPVYKGYDKPVPPPRPAPYTAWGTGWGDFGQFRGDGNAATLDRSLGGFIAGVDTRVDGSYFNNWHIGVAGGYSNDSLSVPGRGSSGTFEMYYGGLYGGAHYGAIDVKFGALGGGTHLDTSRTIAFPGFFDTAQASLGGTMAQGFGEVGYKFALPRGFIEPFAQGAAIYYGQDGFAESGGPAALRGAGRDYNFQTTLLGFKVESAPFANLPIIARVVLGWRHAFGDLTPASVLAFEAGGPDFTVFGAPIDQDAVLAEAGFDYRATNNLTIGVNYSGQAGERAYDNAVKGRLEYKF